MQKFVCPNNCCNIYTKDNISKHTIVKNRRKAGVFIYDAKLNKVLLIQSNGNLWGPPKGTIKDGESERQCAVREVKEETGLEISPNDFTRGLNIDNKAIYFYLEKNECVVTIPDGVDDNDATGITWIKPKCLEQCIISGNISLSQHCYIVFSKFINKRFPRSDFIEVKKKKSKPF